MEGVGRAGEGRLGGLWRRLIKKRAIRFKQQSKKEERKWGARGGCINRETRKSVKLRKTQRTRMNYVSIKEETWNRVEKEGWRCQKRSAHLPCPHYEGNNW